jgi:CBS domain-containing protein
MNNILFFMTPKALCQYVFDDYTVRQALEKMEAVGYAALPILNKRGEYRGTIT